MTKTIGVFIASVLAGHLWLTGGIQAAEQIPFEKAIQDATVTVQAMTDRQTESLIMGNGDMNGVVWSDAGQPYIRINKNDIWDARVDTSQDGEMPKVDIAAGTVTGDIDHDNNPDTPSVINGPTYSYWQAYPQPRCAAALRFGSEGVSWDCVWRNGEHEFTVSEDLKKGVMKTSGNPNAGVGYGAEFRPPILSSELHFNIKGTPNAKYALHVLNDAGQITYSTQHIKCPADSEAVVFKFKEQLVGNVKLFGLTADGKAAESHFKSVYLSGAAGKTDVEFPRVELASSGSTDLLRAVTTVTSFDKSRKTDIRFLADRNVVMIRTPYHVALEPIKPQYFAIADLGKTDGIQWLHQKIPGDENGDWGGMEYALALAAKGDLKMVSLVTSTDIGSGNVVESAIALARETLAEEESRLISRHEQKWMKFWARSGVKLADQDMQRWWYRVLYYAKTVCEPGRMPVGVLPPLATDATPWHGDYHMNYNTWQAYWALPAANHPELTDPWISYLNSMVPRFKWFAEETYGIEGMYVPIATYLYEPDPAVCKSKNKRQITMNPYCRSLGILGLTVDSLWHKHLLDPDRDYLEKKIYPGLREAAIFFTEFMAKCKRDDNGKVLLGPSYAPEIGPGIVYNGVFDIPYVAYVFDAFTQAAGELNRDRDLVETCRQYKALLPDYPTTQYQGKELVADFKGCGFTGHNVPNPAFPVFPTGQVTWFSSEDEKTLFRDTLETLLADNGNADVIENVAKARLSMPLGYIDGRKIFKGLEIPNGLFMWKGHAHGTYMPEQIGLVGLINEFLMQSVTKTIRVFPGWPEDMNAEFVTLRAQGGFLVSARKTNGEVVKLEIESTVGGKLRVVSPWETIKANGKELRPDEKGIVSIDTKAGEAVIFTR